MKTGLNDKGMYWDVFIFNAMLFILPFALRCRIKKAIFLIKVRIMNNYLIFQGK